MGDHFVDASICYIVVNRYSGYKIEYNKYPVLDLDSCLKIKTSIKDSWFLFLFAYVFLTVCLYGVGEEIGI